MVDGGEMRGNAKAKAKSRANANAEANAAPTPLSLSVKLAPRPPASPLAKWTDEDGVDRAHALRAGPPDRGAHNDTLQCRGAGAVRVGTPPMLCPALQ